MAGVLLNFLSGKNAELASGCYRSPVFRCFPLLPSPENRESLMVLQVSNTHKISKLAQKPEKKHLFGDLMIPDKYLDEPELRWQERARSISMKGASGMLVVGRDGRVELLRSGDIPRYYSAHGVVNGDTPAGDNLFTMESVRIRKFTGLVLLPVEAADALLAMLAGGRPAIH